MTYDPHVLEGHNICQELASWHGRGEPGDVSHLDKVRLEVRNTNLLDYQGLTHEISTIERSNSSICLFS